MAFRNTLVDWLARRANTRITSTVLTLHMLEGIFLVLLVGEIVSFVLVMDPN
jgi:hypothetical protein